VTRVLSDDKARFVVEIDDDTISIPSACTSKTYAIGVFDTRTKCAKSSDVFFTVPALDLPGDSLKKSCVKINKFNGGKVRATYKFYKRSNSLELFSSEVSFDILDVKPAPAPGSLLGKYLEYSALLGRNDERRRLATERQEICLRLGVLATQIAEIDKEAEKRKCARAKLEMKANELEAQRDSMAEETNLEPEPEVF
jgi:hypothetical protein